MSTRVRTFESIRAPGDRHRLAPVTITIGTVPNQVTEYPADPLTPLEGTTSGFTAFRRITIDGKSFRDNLASLTDSVSQLEYDQVAGEFIAF
jgi:hypothetical protein